MRPDPNSPPISSFTNFDTSSSASSSSSGVSASTDQRQSPPFMFSPEADGMEVDVASDDKPSAEEQRYGTKRAWSEDRSGADQQHKELSSSEPLSKKRRVQAPSLEFDVVRDADFIKLIRTHGGQIMGVNGQSIQLSLPAEECLKFRVAYTCLRLERLVQKRPFPGQDAFIPCAYMAFADCLQAASLANQADLVGKLLDTGMQAPPELIAPLLNAALAAGAIAAAEVLCDAENTPSGASALENYPAAGSMRTLPLPPGGWQQQVKHEINGMNLDELLACFGQGGDQERGLSLLFGPQDKRPAGQFCIRLLHSCINEFGDILHSCGALWLGNNKRHGTLYLHAGDFNHAQLKSSLLELNAQDIHDATEDPDEQIVTALMFAVQWGDAELVEALLKSGAKPGTKDPLNMTALHLAAWAGNLSIIRQLLAHQPDLNALNNKAYTPLAMAAKRGHFNICSLLLDSGDPAQQIGDDLDVDIDTPERKKPLFLAAQNGDAAICTLLIKRGADVNIKDTFGNTPLLIAAEGGHLACCKTLLRHGADVRTRIDDTSVVTVAVMSGNCDLVKYLLQNGASLEDNSGDTTALMMAASKQLPDMLKLLLELGADVNQQNESGSTALMGACLEGWIEGVEILLQKGANPNLLTNDHQSSLRFVAGETKVYIKILKLLIRYGADLHSGNNGFEQLGEEINQGNDRGVALLLEHHVPTDPLSRGLKQHVSPLLSINYSAHTEADLTILTMLLEHGAPLHHVNEKGDDPLMLATEAGDKECVSALLLHDAQIGQRNSNGDNALQIAIRKLEAHLAGTANHPGADLILSMLLTKMHTQATWLNLREDALNTATHVFVRDMLLLSWVWGNMSKAAKLLAPMNDALYVTLIDDLKVYFQSPTSADRKIQIVRSLALGGLTSPVIKLLTPFMTAFTHIKPQLMGVQSEPNDAAMDTFIAGMFASLEAILALPKEQWRPYDNSGLSLITKNTLTDVSHALLVSLVEMHIKQEESYLSPAFATLFESCLDCVPQPWTAGELLSAQTAPAGAISSSLKRRGVYAAFADQIESAWAEAWDATVTATAARAQAANSSALTWDSLTGEDILDMLFKQSIPFSSEETTPDFSAMPVAAELLAAFRQTLQSRINTPGTDILKLPETTLKLLRDFYAKLVSDADTKHKMDADARAVKVRQNVSAVEKIYAELMARQLHMLAQFIRGENELHKAET